MQLFTFLMYVGVTTAIPCKVIGPGPAQCRTCPSTSCAIVGSTLESGTDIQPLCEWPQGEAIGGNSEWVYLPTGRCFLWASRTDCTLNTIGICYVTVGQGFLPPRNKV